MTWKDCVLFCVLLVLDRWGNFDEENERTLLLEEELVL